MGRLDEQLDRLATLSPADLRAEWQRLWKTTPPRLSSDLLRLGLAYRVQEKALGKLPVAVARSINRRPSPTTTIKPGTQFVRSWNGRTVEVLVVEEGYLFEGRAFRSLSAIAREVTGAGWSGPRFFGLTTHG